MQKRFLILASLLFSGAVFSTRTLSAEWYGPEFDRLAPESRKAATLFARAALRQHIQRIEAQPPGTNNPKWVFKVSACGLVYLGELADKAFWPSLAKHFRNDADLVTTYVNDRLSLPDLHARAKQNEQQLLAIFREADDESRMSVLRTANAQTFDGVARGLIFISMACASDLSSAQVGTSKKQVATYDQSIDCDRVDKLGGNNYETGQCAGRARLAADAQLNLVYAQLRAELNGTDGEKALVTAQRAWITWRDKEAALCAQISGFSPAGSGYGSALANCLSSSTAERTTSLRVLLRTVKRQ